MTLTGLSHSRVQSVTFSWLCGFYTHNNIAQDLFSLGSTSLYVLLHVESNQCGFHCSRWTSQRVRSSPSQYVGFENTTNSITAFWPPSTGCATGCYQRSLAGWVARVGGFGWKVNMLQTAKACRLDVYSHTCELHLKCRAKHIRACWIKLYSYVRKLLPTSVMNVTQRKHKWDRRYEHNVNCKLVIQHLLIWADMTKSKEVDLD